MDDEGARLFCHHSSPGIKRKKEYRGIKMMRHGQRRGVQQRDKILRRILTIIIFASIVTTVLFASLSYRMGLEITNEAFIPPSFNSNEIPRNALYVQGWSQTWGGGGTDVGRGTAVDNAGNVYLVGYTNSYGAGGYDAFLAKYASNGTQIWNQTWGGAGNDYGYGVAAASSGNVFIAGYTSSFGAGGNDAFIAKYTSDGTQLWNRTWGGTGDDDGYGVSADNSGNAFLAGTTTSYGAGSSDAFLVKFAPDGTQQWNHTWGGASFDKGYGTTTDASGYIYLVGWTACFGAGSADAFLAKYDTNGVQLWNRTWGGPIDDDGMAIASDPSGNVFIGGYTSSFGAGGYDSFIAKYTSDGTQLWNRTWGGTNQDDGYGVAADGSGNSYLAGLTASFGAGGPDAFLVKYAPDGTQLWNKTWGGILNDYGYGVAVDNSNNVYLAGEASGSDAFLTKYIHVPPPITVKTPQVGSIFGCIAPNFSVIVADSEVNASWYRVADCNVNHSFTPGILTPVDAADWDIQPNGTVVLNFWANDTQGDLGYINTTVSKDVIAPSITSTGLAPGQLCGAAAPAFSLAIAGGGNLNATWYSLDGGLTNTTCSLAGTLAAQWGGRGNGTVTVTFWVNDSVGNISSVVVVISKDITPPAFVTTGLAPNQLCGLAAPAFSLNISEGDLAQVWYTLDGGATNTSCGLTGDLRTQWGNCGNGTITVTFWANDTAGNLGWVNVTLRKDTHCPQIAVVTPSSGTNFTGAPGFSLILIDANLTIAWYTVGSDPTPHYFTGTSSTIDATAWAAAPLGSVMLTFYAQNAAGNTNSTYVTVVKAAASLGGNGGSGNNNNNNGNESPGGLSLSIILLISIVSGVVAIAVIWGVVMRRRKRSLSP